MRLIEALKHPNRSYIYILLLALRDQAVKAVEDGELPDFIRHKLYLFKAVQVSDEAFTRLLAATKTILNQQRLSAGVLKRQLLKRKIVRSESAVNAFLARAVAQGDLKKSRNGRKVYYTTHKPEVREHKHARKKNGKSPK
jgi:hypothetical protein